MNRALAITALVILTAIDLRAQERQEFRVPRAAEPPKIDGVLNDAAWTQEPLVLSDWVSYNPLLGEKMPMQLRTEVRIAYDDRNIYFAFHCFDNEPDKI